MDASPLTHERIVKLAFAFREAKVVLSAVELEVFTVLAEGPLDLEALRNRTRHRSARGPRLFRCTRRDWDARTPQ